MSQTELHQLLYTALASGSADGTQRPDSKSLPNRAAPRQSINATPQDIIAHYDFKVRQFNLSAAR